MSLQDLRDLLESDGLPARGAKLSLILRAARNRNLGPTPVSPAPPVVSSGSAASFPPANSSQILGGGPFGGAANAFAWMPPKQHQPPAAHLVAGAA